jgi:predicted neuraminidase
MQARPPPFEAEHLFGDERPFAQCHAVTLLRRADGRFIAAWFGGSYEGHPDVAIWAATREADDSFTRAPSPPGARWSPPRIVARVRDTPHWNPVLFALDAAGRDLVLHFKVGRRIRRWETWWSRSSDGGETWSEPRPLVPGDRGGRGAVRCKPIRLSSGAWIAGASTERWRRWNAFFDRSPDGVGQWRASAFVPVDRSRVGKGLIQPTLWESAPGHVHALFRSTGGRVYRADSSDEGLTWGHARPIDIPHNNSGIDVVRLTDGRLVLACNPVESRFGRRTPLSLLTSNDGGETWPHRIDIETAAGEFSYPALIPDGDGLALAYTWNRRRIAFLRLAATDLPGRSD